MRIQTLHLFFRSFRAIDPGIEKYARLFRLFRLFQKDEHIHFFFFFSEPARVSIV